MKTLIDLYEEYKKAVEEPVDYDDWLYDEFGADLYALSNYDKCLLYNEYADKTQRTMWENIDDITEVYGSDFLHVYSLIDHDKFDIYDDVIVEENGLIVSYTYEDFVDIYWDTDVGAG